MKLTILVDNNTFIGRYFLAEPSLSMYIEVDGKKILFDVGYSDVFIKNAVKMGINLLDLDYLVLSHGHLDHTWGLAALIKLYTEAEYEKHKYRKPTIVAHPDIFYSKSKNNLAEIGSLISKEKAAQNYELQLTDKPFQITKNLIFLGQIPRINDFEGKDKIGTIIKDEAQDDYMIDDSALVYKTSEGLVVITACSHSGICNIIEYAKKICQDDLILDVIGGFHLLKPSEKQMKSTLEYFKTLNPKTVHACHCTTLHSKIELSKVVNIKEAGVGLSLEYS